MSGTKQVWAAMYRSANGRDNWEVVMPADIPEWVKGEDNIRRMMAGEACMKCDEGPTGSAWYRLERVLPPSDAQRVQAAQDKRTRRAARRIASVH